MRVPVVTNYSQFFTDVMDTFDANFGAENMFYELIDYADKLGVCYRCPKTFRRFAIRFDSFCNEMVVSPSIDQMREWIADPFVAGVGVGDTMIGGEWSAFRIASDALRKAG